MALPMLRVYGECTGNFQNRERMQLQKAARIRYGRFFYRFPNGESAADVYDRITGKFWFLLSHNVHCGDTVDMLWGLVYM
jgi:hypothetical protein